MQSAFCRVRRITKQSGGLFCRRTAMPDTTGYCPLTDGCVEIDNNPIALNRKNTLFAGHEAGIENWAMIASLIEICKLNKVDPFDWRRHAGQHRSGP